MYSDNIAQEQEIVEFPWLVFKVKNNLYTINSEIINSIVIMPDEITNVPNVPKYITGLIHLRGSVIPLLDLRLLFNIKSVNDEYDEFKKMIDLRKNEHIHWVNEFEYSVKNNKEFMLETDPHRCNFGKWYDNFASDIESVNFHLKKLDEPHKRIHKAAEDADNCSKKCDDCNREKCLQTVLEEAKEVNMPYMVKLLDEIKEVFRLNYKEMIVVLEKDNSYVGITVDEVLSVDNIDIFEETDEIKKICNGKYINGVAKGGKNKDVLLMIDSDKLMNIAEHIV